MILERSSYEENFTYHLKYPISQKKKKAALENVMQFLEFLTTAETASDVWIKINGAIESREISQNPITLKRRTTRRVHVYRERYGERDEKANNKRDDSTNRRSGTIVEQLERRHSFDVPRASTNYAGAQN